MNGSALASRHFDVEPGLKKVCYLLLSVGLVAIVVPVSAEPPANAPAHGWRKNNDPFHVGYTGRKWRDDYGVVDGSCNRAAVGAALGGALGGLVGSTVDDADSRSVAIVLGTTMGALIGAKIGRDLDEADRACIGHALELGESGRPVRWVSDGVAYTLTPGEASGKVCRSYLLRGEAGGRSEVAEGAACRRNDGAWVPRG